MIFEKSHSFFIIFSLEIHYIDIRTKARPLPADLRIWQPMERYKNYRFEDFLNDDEFREWALSRSADTDSKWAEILLRYPDKAEDLERAAVIVREWKKQPSALSDAQMVSDIGRIMRNIEEPEKKHIPRTYTPFVRYAAAVILMLGIGWLAWQQTRPAGSDAPIAYRSGESDIEIVNDRSSDLEKTLPDGSVVTLSPGSRISYAASFTGSDSRNVSLSGEAFFQVVKDSLRPFFVYSGGIATRVLGTSFTVRSGAEDVSVTVRTGKVAVYVLDEKKENIVLTPNQKAVYTSSDKTITRTLVEEPLIVRRQELDSRFHFDEVPAATIFEALEKAYGIPIRFDKTIMQHCLLTLPFREEPFYRKLDILCRTIGATYRVDGNQIVIESNGCE